MKAKAIIAVVIVLAIAGGAVYVFSGSQGETNTNTSNQSANLNMANTSTTNTTNENTNSSNQNTNSDEPAPVEVTNSSITMEGKVFLKGYKTPSESFGILTGDGQEVGLGSYDQEKEQFRPSIGESVKVIYSKICRSNKPDCCRSLFTYCGVVESWEEIQ